jgi:HK97 family phage major capsid protein
MATMTELIELRTKASAAAKELNSKAEADNNRDFTPEEEKQFHDHLATVDSLTKKIERQSKVSQLSEPTPRLTTATNPIDSEPRKAPATAKRYVPLNYLKNSRVLSSLQERQDAAYATGMWVRGCMGNARARQWCSERGMGFNDVEVRGHEESTLTTGGYLVPDQMDNAMIDLKEQRGVFRQYARVSPMSADKKVRLRRTGGLTAYFTAEGGAITESTMAWDRVVLVAKDLGCVALVTNDLNEDATISLGDTLIGEMAYAFADKED